jgi:hypothetical protein
LWLLLILPFGTVSLLAFSDLSSPFAEAGDKKQYQRPNRSRHLPKQRQESPKNSQVSHDIGGSSQGLRSLVETLQHNSYRQYSNATTKIPNVGIFVLPSTDRARKTIFGDFAV